MAWMLATAMAGKEFEASNRLNSAGIVSYIPTYQRSIQPRHTRSPRIVTYPLFARYLFLWVDQLSRELNTIREHGHAWPVRSDTGSPLIVPDHELDAIRSRVAAGEFDAIDHGPHDGLLPGMVVSVSLGNLTRKATITHLLRRRRLRLILDDSSLVITANVDLVSLSQ